MVPPACEKIHLMSRIARERAAEQQARHRAGGVVRHLDHRRERADAQPSAAGRHQRMDVDHGLAAVQLLQHRLVHRIAQPFVAVVGLQVDAVGLDGVEGVFDLLQRHVDVHHRQRREHAEAARIVAAASWRRSPGRRARSWWRPRRRRRTTGPGWRRATSPRCGCRSCPSARSASGRRPVEHAGDCAGCCACPPIPSASSR